MMFTQMVIKSKDKVCGDIQKRRRRRGLVHPWNYRPIDVRPQTNRLQGPNNRELEWNRTRYFNRNRLKVLAFSVKNLKNHLCYSIKTIRTLRHVSNVLDLVVYEIVRRLKKTPGRKLCIPYRTF